MMIRRGLHPPQPQRSRVSASHCCGGRATVVIRAFRGARLLGRTLVGPEQQQQQEQQQQANQQQQQQQQPGERSFLLGLLSWVGSSSNDSRQSADAAGPPPAAAQSQQEQGDLAPMPSDYMALLFVSLLWGSYTPALRYLYSMDPLLTPQVLTAHRTVISATALIIASATTFAIDRYRQHQRRQQELREEQELREREEQLRKQWLLLLPTLLLNMLAPFGSSSSNTTSSRGHTSKQQLLPLLFKPSGTSGTSSSSSGSGSADTGPALLGSLLPRLQGSSSSTTDDSSSSSASATTSSSSSNARAPLSAVMLAGLELGTWNFLATAAQACGLNLSTATKAAFLGQTTAVFTPCLALLCGQAVLPSHWFACLAALLGSLCITLDTVDMPASSSSSNSPAAVISSMEQEVSSSVLQQSAGPAAASVAEALAEGVLPAPPLSEDAATAAAEVVRPQVLQLAPVAETDAAAFSSRNSDSDVMTERVVDADSSNSSVAFHQMQPDAATNQQQQQQNQQQQQQQQMPQQLEATEGLLMDGDQVAPAALQPAGSAAGLAAAADSSTVAPVGTTPAGSPSGVVAAYQNPLPGELGGNSSSSSSPAITSVQESTTASSIQSAEASSDAATAAGAAADNVDVINDAAALSSSLEMQEQGPYQLQQQQQQWEAGEAAAPSQGGSVESADPGAVTKDSSWGLTGEVYILLACCCYAIATVRLSMLAPGLDPVQLATSKTLTLAAASLCWLLAYGSGVEGEAAAAAGGVAGEAAAGSMAGTAGLAATAAAASSGVVGQIGAAVQSAAAAWQLPPAFDGGQGRLLLFYSALGPGALATVLQTKGQGTVAAVQAQVFYSLTPVWAAFLATTCLQGEEMGPLAWVGGGIILSASIGAAISGSSSTAAPNASGDSLSKQ